MRSFFPSLAEAEEPVAAWCSQQQVRDHRKMHRRLIAPKQEDPLMLTEKKSAVRRRQEHKPTFDQEFVYPEGPSYWHDDRQYSYHPTIHEAPASPAGPVHLRQYLTPLRRDVKLGRQFTWQLDPAPDKRTGARRLFIPRQANRSAAPF
ncbi:hypothetical protein CYMTET_25198, partial [Cymbomonas tetramitiformis]